MEIFGYSINFATQITASRSDKANKFAPGNEYQSIPTRSRPVIQLVHNSNIIKEVPLIPTIVEVGLVSIALCIASRFVL